MWFWTFKAEVNTKSTISDQSSVVKKTDSILKHDAIYKPQQVPVLCYHNIHERTAKNNPLLTLSESEFRSQIKSLSDSGYHTVSPEQLYNYVIEGITLPYKSVMITFDDTHAEDYSIASPVLEQYGFRGIFFVSTVCMDKKNYLTGKQIKELSEKGNIIAGHTWDHPDLTTTNDINWKKQLYFPKLYLENLTGKPVYYFAYPNGSWNFKVIDSLKQYGYKAAFQLNEKQSEKEPLFTTGRIMVSANWSPVTLQARMKKKFN